MRLQTAFMLFVLAATACLAWACHAPAAEWSPVPGHIMTPFAKDVRPDNALPEYPRPQMVRDRWQNLNGLWQYAVETLPSGTFTPVLGLAAAASFTDARPPDAWQGTILVPFAIDAPLSGVGHILRPNERLWYRRTFTVPDDWRAGRVLLHFGAADWETSVYVNGRRLGQHRGGYDPFTFDVTDALRNGENELVVACWDATEAQCQAIGKQIMPENRKGFRYQPTGGIWRTVWLEPVPATHIRSFVITTEPDTGRVLVDADVAGRAEGARIEADIAGGRPVTRPDPTQAVVLLKDPHPWSPDDPHLYDLTVRLVVGDEVVDTVRSYVGLRKIERKRAADGFVRVHLNGKPIFQFGPLDQGYWPDGILTPPSDEAIRYDLEFLKKIGCNMVRVHVKTHPERWYYWADRLGLLVWQDMICLPKYGQTVTPAASAQWQTELERMMDALRNHPSIIMWVPFNEGWGQHDTKRIAALVAERDPTRLVDSASGWTDVGVGDTLDHHDYSFYPSIALQRYAGGRAVVLGEAGGFNMVVPGHTWHGDKKPSTTMDYTNDGGRPTVATADEMRDVFACWTENLRCLNAAAGLNAVVYTQITDVEHELNGFLTYDRRVPKTDPGPWGKMIRRLYCPPTLKPVAVKGPWKYSAGAPTAGGKNDTGGAAPVPAWATPDFGAIGWQTGRSPFASTRADGLPDVGTVTGASSYRLRRTFTLQRVPDRPALCIRVTRGCRIFINGHLFRNVVNQSRGPGLVQVCTIAFRPGEREWLKEGENTVAVLVPAAKGPNFFDLTLVDVQEP